MRRLGREVRLHVDELILPLFVVPGRDRIEPIRSMPGVQRLSVDRLEQAVSDLAVPAVLLFGVPDSSQKDPAGTASADEAGPVPSAVRAIKACRPDLAVMTDVCLCAYTTTGHCGLLDSTGRVADAPTRKALGAMALAHGRAGADVIAPSAMADGQVAACREALDAEGLTSTAILSYASKFASAYYGPFRDAAASAPQFGDRRGYQLDPANRREAVREALADKAEGADWLMVKPALPCLDVIADVRAATTLPLAAYQVSGEYAMLKAAGAAGVLDERAAALEALTAIKRAGADAVITYYAREACTWIGR